MNIGFPMVLLITCAVIAFIAGAVLLSKAKESAKTTSETTRNQSETTRNQEEGDGDDLKKLSEMTDKELTAEIERCRKASVDEFSSSGSADILTEATVYQNELILRELKKQKEAVK